MEQRTISFKTVGCRLNQAETARITGQFISAGYDVVPFGEHSDVCVIHSCAITANAERKSAQYARSARKTNPSSFIVVAGCATEVNKTELQEKSGANLLAGQHDKYRLLELISLPSALPHFPSTHSGLSPHPSALPHFPTTRALIKVQDGCDFRCAYCIVPDARGKPFSRPFGEIIDETKMLADSGYREVVLTGANLGCYNDRGQTLVELLTRIEAIKAIERIRISSIEMSTTEKAIIDHMSQSKKMCHYIHLPLQTGDNGMLTAMGRRYTTSEYAAFIEYATGEIPTLGLGTDILVGLPGESESAHDNTVKMVSNLPFSNLHVFPYSSRKGTPAAEMSNQVPEKTKKERCEQLAAIGEEKKQTFARQFIGTPVSILTERVNSDGSATGWTSEYIEARLSGHNLEPNRVVTFTPEEYDGKRLLENRADAVNSY